jgi:hypothetical protein
MSHIVIAAADVKKGDRIFNRLATHPAFRWVWVTAVEVTGRQVAIHTSGWYTVKHVREGVAVERLEET